MRSVISMESTLIQRPAIEPISVTDAKLAIRFRSSAEDALLSAWVEAARAYFEEITGRQLITALWETRFNGGPCGSVIELPHAPLMAVDAIFTTDDDGAETAIEVESYRVRPSGTVGSPLTFAAVDPHCAPGRVELVTGESWPTDGFTVRYWAGYGDTSDQIPGLVKAALFLLVGHFHKYRSEVHELERAASVVQLPFGADAILKQFKYTALPTLRPERSSWA